MSDRVAGVKQKPSNRREAVNCNIFTKLR